MLLVSARLPSDFRSWLPWFRGLDDPETRGSSWFLWQREHARRKELETYTEITPISTSLAGSIDIDLDAGKGE